MALSLAIVGAPGPGVRAQVAHPPIEGPRPVHARLAVADRVVHVRIVSVETGRIQVESAGTPAGADPARFEIKRSPAAPPPLVPGDEAILLLRGARPPYILVDGPREIIPRVDPAAAGRWMEALAALAAAAGDPAAQAAVYLDWIDRGPAGLRGLAATGLGAILDAEPPLAAAIGRRRLALVTDAGAPDDVRLISARLAARSPESAGALCEALARDPRPLDPATADVALRAGARARAPQVFMLLERVAGDPDPLVRLTATRALPVTLGFAREETIARAHAIAAHETDRRVRESAERILRDAARPPPRQRGGNLPPPAPPRAD